MSDDEPPVDEQPPPDDEHEAKVLVFRTAANDTFAVPDDVVTEAERAYRCHQHHLQGKSWDEIALEEQYPSGRAAKADVDRYMAEARSLVSEKTMRDMLTLEVMRLDALQAAIWPNAMMGHVPSATFVLNVIMSRAKLIGLDPDRMAEQLQQRQSHTVIVPPDSDGYVAALQHHAETPPE